MAERYDVVITVKEQKGHCAWGHQKGDQWVCSGTTPGGVFPWAKDPDAVEVTCSDGINPVTFELRRVRK